MLYMKTASVRDVRRGLARVLAWVEAGEEVSITRRRLAVARLVPLRRRRLVKRPMPDLAARLTKVFGKQVIPDQVVWSILGRVQ